MDMQVGGGLECPMQCQHLPRRLAEGGECHLCFRPNQQILGRRDEAQN